MKIALFSIVLVLVATIGTEVYIFAPAYKDGDKFMPFLDGIDYRVTTRYYIKEVSVMFLVFSLLLSLSAITALINQKCAVFFWVFASYKFFSLFLYMYNHCSWAWPYYITISVMIVWAIYLFTILKPWKKMKIVK